MSSEPAMGTVLCTPGIPLRGQAPPGAIETWRPFQFSIPPGDTVCLPLELTFVKKLQIGVDVASGKLACVAGANSPFGGQAIYELASALQNERVKQDRKKRPRAGTQTVEAVDEGRPFENERRVRDKPPKPKCPKRSQSRSGSQEEELLHSEISQPKHSFSRFGRA